jgi:uncharacterized protein YkwD
MKAIKYLVAVFIVLSAITAKSQSTGVYKEVPDVANCKAGSLNDAEKLKLLNYFNTLRAVHGLKPVTWNYAGDKNAQEAALINVANATLTHYPEKTLHCYTPVGDTGCQKSNLMAGAGFTNYNSTASIDGWLIDDKNQMGDDVGHRRAVLNPFVTQVSFGRVEGNPIVSGPKNYISMSMFYGLTDEGDASYMAEDFIACPYHNYKSNWINKNYFLSFSAFVDKTQFYFNNIDVDYSKATVKMYDPSGAELAVSSIGYDNKTWGGIANCLRWKAANMKNDTKYKVVISNVTFKGKTMNYEYWFNITDKDNVNLAQTTLAQPSDKSKDLSYEKIDFSWNSVTNAKKYKFQLSKAADFATTLTEQEFTATSCQINSGLEESTTYYWRVRAVADEYQGDWSATNSFSTKTAPLPVIALEKPLNKATSTDLYEKFIWKKATNAYVYEFQLSSSNDFTNTSALVQNATDLQDTIFYDKNTPLAKNTTYYWRVRAQVGMKFTDWASPYSFTTGATSDVEIPANEYSIYSFSIQPNVITNGKINLNFFTSKSDESYSLSVIDSKGSLVYKLDDIGATMGENVIDINASGFSSGIYQVTISNSKGRFINKTAIVQN